MARDWKFPIQEVEGLYYLCSENKGADQLCGYREADLRLCFRICKNPVFSQHGSFYISDPSCSLCSVALSRCGINSAGMTELQKGLAVNHSLTEFNLNGSEVTC